MKRLLAAFLIAFMTPAFAATWYVRQDGSDTACDGDTNAAVTGNRKCAFGKISKAISMVTAGGNEIRVVGPWTVTECTGGATIQVGTGRNGSVGNWNVVKGYAGAVTLSGQNGLCDSAADIRSQFWQIGDLGTNEGFIVDGGYPAVSLPPKDGTIDILESNNRVWGNTLQGSTFGSYPADVGTVGEIAIAQLSGNQSSVNFDIRNNDITVKNFPSGIYQNTGSSCAAFTGDTGCSNCPTNTSYIVGNRIATDNAHLSERKSLIFSHSTKGVTMEGNYLQNGDLTHSGTSTTTTGLLYMRDVCQWTIQNNYFQGNDAGGSSQYFVYFQQGCTPACSQNQQNKYLANTFYGETEIGIYSSGPCQNCEWRQNNFIGYASGDIGSAIRFAFACGPTSGSSGPYGWNSFFNVTTQTRGDDGSAADCRLDQPGSNNNEQPDGHNKTSDPVIVGSGNFPTPFLRLQAGSPLVNAGCNRSTECVGNPDKDYEQENRSNPGDIGADEQSASAQTCPNNTREGTEVCDGTDLNGRDCRDFGYSAAGTLACQTNCMAYDFTGCPPATFYVHASGSDTSCTGLADNDFDGTCTGCPGALDACAFASPAKGCTSLRAGDTLILKGANTYTQTATADIPGWATGVTMSCPLINKMGTGPSKPIIIKGAGGLVTLDGPANLAFGIDHSGYVRIGGSGANEGIKIGASYDPTIGGTKSGGAVTMVQASPGFHYYGNTHLGATTPTAGSATANSAAEIAVLGVLPTPPAPYVQVLNDLQIFGNTVAVANLGRGIVVGKPAGSGCDAACSSCDLGTWVQTNDYLTYLSGNVMSTTRQDVSYTLIEAQGTGSLSIDNNYLVAGASGANVDAGSRGIVLTDSCTAKVEANIVEGYGLASAIAVNDQAAEGDENERHLIDSNTIYGTGVAGLDVTNCDGCTVVNDIVHGVSAATDADWDTAVLCGAVASKGNGVMGDNAFRYYAGSPYNNSGTAGECSAVCGNYSCIGTDKTGALGVHLTSTKPRPFFEVDAGSALIAAGCAYSNCPGMLLSDFCYGLASTGCIARANPPDIGADQRTAGPVCGNNTRETGELCDGTDLNSKTCATLGSYWDGGTLACASSCQSWNEAACTSSVRPPQAPIGGCP